MPIRKPNKQKVDRLCLNFSEHTTSHGIYWIGSSKSKRKKRYFFWVAAFSFCLIFFLFQAKEMIERFLRFDTIVNVQLKFETAVFPAVTLCNLNPYKMSKIQGVQSIKKTLDSYSNAMAKTDPTEVGERSGGSLRRQRRQTHESKDTFFDQFRFKMVRIACECNKTSAPCEPIYNIKLGMENVSDSRGKRYFHSNKNVHTCTCFYDTKLAFLWPCYHIRLWRHAICEQCSNMGSCLAPRIDLTTLLTTNPPPLLLHFSTEFEVEPSLAGTPCICQNVSHICAAHPIDQSPYYYDQVKDSTTPSLPSTTPAPTTTLSPEEELKEIQFEAAQGYENMSDEVAITTKAKDNLIFTTARLPSELKSNISYEKHEFIRMCSFNGGQCDIEKDFKQHLDSVYGNCFIFNYERDSNLTTNRAGPTYGLRIMVYVHADDYLPTTEALGVRIAVHNQSEYPFPDTFGFSAPTGYISSFGISSTRITRMPAPHGDCIESSDRNETLNLYKNYSYSTEGCHRSCLQRALIARCGCGEPRFPIPPEYKSCGPENAVGRDCLAAGMAEYGGRDSPLECPCNQPCRQMAYSTSFSTSVWPAPTFRIRECTKSVEKCVEEYRKNGALIEVFYEQLNYEFLQESEAYGWVNLLADFGGQLGLWLGVSVLTCFEFVVLLMDFFRLWWAENHPPPPLPPRKVSSNGDLTPQVYTTDEVLPEQAPPEPEPHKPREPAVPHVEVWEPEKEYSFNFIPLPSGGVEIVEKEDTPPSPPRRRRSSVADHWLDIPQEYRFSLTPSGKKIWWDKPPPGFDEAAENAVNKNTEAEESREADSDDENP